MEFHKLMVYKKSKVFHTNCLTILRQGVHERYVIDQLTRASFSIPLNIAEGSGKLSKLDRRKYFTIARASVFECIAILDILSDQAKISQADFDAFYRDGDEISRVLYAMIRNLSQ